MSITWVDPYDDEPNKTLSGLIKSYVDKEDPSHAVYQILRLTSYLLLSNHLTEAHAISSAVFQLIEDFEINDNGKSFDIEISTPLALEIFWHAHQSEFPRPIRAPSNNKESPDVYLPQKAMGQVSRMHSHGLDEGSAWYRRVRGPLYLASDK